jgi:hypothetical protein
MLPSHTFSEVIALVCLLHDMLYRGMCTTTSHTPSPLVPSLFFGINCPTPTRCHRLTSPGLPGAVAGVPPV